MSVYVHTSKDNFYTICFKKKSSLKKCKKITYIKLYIKLLYIIVYEQFFLHFSKLIFFLKRTMKINALIIFKMFSHYYYYFTLKNNFTKERYMNMYGHISYMIIHIDGYLFIHIYTYSCIKHFLLSRCNVTL